MTKAELIVRVLDLAAKRIDSEDDEDSLEVATYARRIQQRYSELKRIHDFTASARLARLEFVTEILADAPPR